VTVLRWAGVLLLVGIAVVHARLWWAGYRTVEVIGPLFALDVVLAGLCAAAVAVAHRRWLGLAALAGAALAAGTAGGLLLSTRVPLFGFRESLAAADARLSLVLEGAATVVLLTLAAVSARDRSRRPDAVPRTASRGPGAPHTAR
jgi:hypothetical protein